MDKRYIKLIIDHFPYEQPKWMSRGVMFCFMAFILAVLAIFSNSSYLFPGMAIGLASSMGMIAIAGLSMWRNKKKAKQAMLSYEATGKLPEWPAENESLQPNN